MQCAEYLDSDPSIDAAPEICEGLSLRCNIAACGIATCGTKGRLYQCKANGMVRDVFDNGAIGRLIGSMGVGHGEDNSIHVYLASQTGPSVRYPTAGSSAHAEAQPFYVNSPYGIVLPHVGSPCPLLARDLRYPRMGTALTISPSSRSWMLMPIVTSTLLPTRSFSSMSSPTTSRRLGNSGSTRRTFLPPLAD